MASKTHSTNSQKADAATDATSQSVLHYPTAPQPAQGSHDSLNRTERICDYLRHRLPGYPFDPQLDADYVEELVDDFPDINILAEIKAFRWYYNNKPFSGSKQPRVALRRWLENAWPAA
jgi:hypothetical protein